MTTKLKNICSCNAFNVSRKLIGKRGFNYLHNLLTLPVFIFKMWKYQFQMIIFRLMWCYLVTAHSIVFMYSFIEQSQYRIQRCELSDLQYWMLPQIQHPRGAEISLYKLDNSITLYKYIFTKYSYDFAIPDLCSEQMDRFFLIIT